MKRYLYLVHRWLGITLCLFMAMWFLSGIVMMYVGYPKLTPDERRAGAGSIDPARCCVDLATALAATGESRPPDSVRLTSIAGTPTYVFTYAKTQAIAVRGDNGLRVQTILPEVAVQAARSFGGGADAEYAGEIQEDAWSHSKALTAHRPLHKVYLSDPAQTLIYVSSATGEVALDVPRTERIWNWVGAWIHWLYPFRGGALDAYWHDIVVYGSLVGTILALSGFIVGLMRWRLRAPYKTGSHSPYRDGYMWWHHIVGLCFGVTAVTFVFSGMMSMNPWKLFDPSETTFDAKAFTGGDIETSRFTLDVSRALTLFQKNGFDPAEIEFRLLDGKGYYVAFRGDGATRILAAEPGAEPQERLSFDLLTGPASRLVKANIVRNTVLTAFDMYYFPREPHTLYGNVDKRLPVMRLEFDDANGTWVHIDPHTGAALGRIDVQRRMSRWLFSFLHSWDWPALLDARPLWDMFMIALNLGGFGMSVTGVVIGWRRLKKKFGRPIGAPTLESRTSST